MKIHVKKSQSIAIAVSIFLLSGFLLAWTEVGWMQSNDDRNTTNGEEIAPTVRAAKRGNPTINFDDGFPLSSGETGGAGQAVAAASADFDSDGIQDMIVAGASGDLTFYKGRDPRSLAVSPTLSKSGRPSAFEIAKSLDSGFGFSPDRVFSGDFNADGNQDLIGVENGATSITLLGGNGQGNFSQPQAIPMSGRITAIETGEIGRRDGQTDVAVSYSSENGHYLAVYEYPEGAFAKEPEVFRLSEPANAITIGNLDEDFYSDIAVASGSNLMIVHGRGQIYPWNLVKEEGMQRPGAVVESRRMPFSIISMAVGRFGDRRGTSLAALTSEGSIYQIESTGIRSSRKEHVDIVKKAATRRVPFIPAGADAGKLRSMPESPYSEEVAKQYGTELTTKADIVSGERMKQIEVKAREAKTRLDKLSKAERSRIAAAAAKDAEASRVRSRQSLIDAVASRSSKLSNWKIELISQPSALSHLGTGAALKKVNVSNSDLDDLMIVPQGGTEITFNTRSKASAGAARVAERTSIESSAGIRDVISVRSNLDAIDDFVVINEGSSVPSSILSAPMATFVVDTLADSGSCSGGDPCSLRGAITAANSSIGTDTIFFNVSGTIAPTSELPVIRDSVNIQGPENNGTMLIEISGANISGANDGLKLRSSNSVIYKLAINRFKSILDENDSLIGGNGITLESTTVSPNNGNNFVFQNFLGTDTSGTIAEGNDATGILVFDSDNNTIQSNVLSGNKGAGLSITGGNSNFIFGNIVGLNSGGVIKVPNFQGMLIMGSSNQIGSDVANAGNTVSGNGFTPISEPERCVGSGVSIETLIDVEAGELLTLNNDVKGNLMGTSSDGSTRLGNCFRGLQTLSMQQTIIGSITQSGRNTISGNGLDGLWCNHPYLELSLGAIGFCSINGNNIGTDVTGSFSIPNDWTNQFSGLVPLSTSLYVANGGNVSNVGAPGGTTPGGPCTGFCNLISGNNFGSDGTAGIFGYGISGVFNNYLGTNRMGTHAVPNNAGLSIGAFGIKYAGYGDATENMGNLISGNSWVQVDASAGSYYFYIPGDVRVEKNLIGTDVSGSNIIQGASTNFAHGINIATFFLGQMSIGGGSFEKQNVISGNWGQGIQMMDLGGQTTVTNNKIGPGYGGQQLGNGGAGVMVTGDSGSVGPGNEIAYNGTNPIEPFGGVVVVGGAFHSIRGNSIHDNIGLGIDLSQRWPVFAGDGVTANDCLDGDVGVNGLQNYPVLLTTTTNDDGDTVIIGYLRSVPSQNYSLDFYRTSIQETNNHGEGANHIGTLEISTNGSGFRSFEFVVPPGGTQFITATATDSFGNTSEFSCDIGSCMDPVRPAGSLQEVDELYGVSICADPIIVNTTTDDTDVDLLDETCDTDDDEPGSQCSLRAALQEAESQAGANAITFDIPGTGPHTITITNSEPLPLLNQPVTIDASTQPGYAGVPLVILDGINTTDAYGFRIRGGSTMVRGFSIINFKEQIGITGSGGMGMNRIGANYIGIKPDGTSGIRARQLFGIALVGGASNNQVGGMLAQHRNIIGSTGVAISINTGSTGNRVNNNHIGVGADGTTSIPNGNGIVLTDSNRNNIGGFINASPNVISNCEEYGIRLINSSANRISGNFIGTNASGTTAAPNIVGVNIQEGSGNNIIGGTTFFEKNVISGHTLTNNSAGVVIRPEAGESNTVAGNYLGVSLNGDAGIPNYIGIVVNADNQYIGNPNEDDYRNLIVSTNTEYAYGIYLHPFFPNDELTNVVVQNNTIGTLSFNDQPSGKIGIYLTDNVSNSTITGNTVGHQSFAGIRLFDGPHNNTISGNRVGIKLTNNEPIPNYNGIAIRQADTNFIRDNVVSANTNHGIAIGDTFGQNDRPAPLSEQQRTFGGSSFAINNVITGNKVGTDVDGTFAIPNGNVGIGVGINARDNRIGGPGAEGNIVGGAAGQNWPFGIFVGTINDVADVEEIPHNIKIEGNRVGVGPNDDFLSNGYGIYVRNAQNTIVGGDTRAKGNIVGNNFNDGIRLFKPLTTDTFVKNNYIGVLPDSTMIGNGGNGISIENIGDVEVELNVIGGNLANGIHVVNMGQQERQPGRSPQLFSIAKIINNAVGAAFDENGVLQDVGNGLNGIFLENAFRAEIGKAAVSNIQNMISGNGGIGVFLKDSSSNKVQNNMIGTGPNGETNVQNLLEGVKLLNSSNNTIGGANAGNPIGGVNAGNTIAGNGTDGVNMELGTGNGMFGNLVGVIRRATGQIEPLANGGNGLSILDSSFNQIGSALPGEGNILASNEQIGILMSGFMTGLNKIHQNKIGVIEALEPRPGQQRRLGINFGNGSHGIHITNAANVNWVGGPWPNTGNIISGNGGTGVWIDPTAGPGNMVDPNSIYQNAGLGIDLGVLGHTANDPLDSDEGPNRMQNYPEIVSNQILNNELIVTFKVESQPGNSNYGMDGLHIEFFKADSDGEGERFLGSTNYTVADYNGSVAGTKTINLGDITVLGINGLDRLTATATDADNNTSEFFPPFGPTAAGVSISGRVTISGQQGINNAVLTLRSDDGQVRRVFTNGFGYFRFEDVEAGRSYVLTVSHKRYDFEHPTRVIMATDDLTDVDFVASP